MYCKLKLLFRHILFILALAACDDLPDQSVDPYLASVENDIATDTLATQLARPSPPAVMVDTIAGVPITVRYGAPSVRGRMIFGGLVPLGEIWRTGANEATTIAFSDTLLINSHPVPPGIYAVFTVPGKDEWTWILNADHDQWGAYNYDAGQDILRTTTRPRQLDQPVETMRIVASHQELVLQWADTEVPLPIASPRTTR